jgi:hypothetical protein
MVQPCIRKEAKMTFIRTDRGDYVSMRAIHRVEKEPIAKVADKTDNGIRVFRLYNAADEPLGAVRVTEDRIALLLAELLPAQPGEKVITLHFDAEAHEVWHQEHRVIAWAFRPGVDSPDPVTPEGIVDERGVKLLLERPDGKLDDIWDREYDSLEDAKKYFLERNLADQ